MLTTTCRFCGVRFARKARGRPAKYCKPLHRVLAFEHRLRRKRKRAGLLRQHSGNDNLQTPPRLARALVAALQPSGRILEPCAGRGAFVRALRPFGNVASCEIDRGLDFFEWSEKVDWVITNPPWSQYARFLAHGLEVADRVAFVSTLNHLWTKSRRDLVRRAGFGIERIIEFDVPKEWPSTGFQLGMVLLTRGHDGACNLEQLGIVRRKGRSHER
jgi:hypothetical protein